MLYDFAAFVKIWICIGSRGTFFLHEGTRDLHSYRQFFNEHIQTSQNKTKQNKTKQNKTKEEDI
jgi:hypothetical protein